MQNVANVKMRHVLTELLETERIYVNEISTILKVPIPTAGQNLQKLTTFCWFNRVIGISWSILIHIRKFLCNWLRKPTFYSVIYRRLALSTARSFFRTWRAALPARSSLQLASYDTYASLPVLHQWFNWNHSKKKKKEDLMSKRNQNIKSSFWNWFIWILKPIQLLKWKQIMMIDFVTRRRVFIYLIFFFDRRKSCTRFIVSTARIFLSPKRCAVKWASTIHSSGSAKCISATNCRSVPTYSNQFSGSPNTNSCSR